jgi:hypothetical protein
MYNEILSLWSVSRRARLETAAALPRARQVPGIVLVVAACVTLPGCGEEDDGVTYNDDVRRIFEQRGCTVCHRPGSPIGIDIQDPFKPETGLARSRNTWNDVPDYAGETPEYNVVAGDPDNSFLMWKLQGEAALPANGHGGSPMPLQLASLTGPEVDVLESWVERGAPNDASFEAEVRPIFGREDTLAGSCIYCHYQGTPNEPDLTNPFGPKGLVDVEARYRADMVRVLPRFPDESLMIKKVSIVRADSDYGAPMPYSYNALTASQIETVRRWILEGARP